MNPQLWIEPVGDLIIVRMRGVPTEALLQECHERLLILLKEAGRSRILHDCLEMETPPIEVPLSQWKLDRELETLKFRRAVVVPNTRLAYLGRIAFAEDNCRIFYNDLTAAVQWLNEH